MSKEMITKTFINDIKMVLPFEFKTTFLNVVEKQKQGNSGFENDGFILYGAIEFYSKIEIMNFVTILSVIEAVGEITESFFSEDNYYCLINFCKTYNK